MSSSAMKKIILLLSVLGCVRRIELLTLPREYQRSLEDGTPGKRIINGEVATLGQIPYQAFLESFFEHGESAMCGGSLLTQNYVLTAAHCVEWDGVATHGTVILGAHNRRLEEPSQQRINFGSINIHPGWPTTMALYDLATVLLETPAVFTEYVQPVVLPALTDTRTFSGKTGTISGFGRTQDGPPASDLLRYARNPILTNADCQAEFGSFPVSPQHICFSGAGLRSACHGDSGGPLTIEEDGRSMQVGIAVFVLGGICTVGVPSGYARVTYFLDWIAENSDVVLRTWNILDSF